MNGVEPISLGQYTPFPETQNSNALAFLAYSSPILRIILAGLLLASMFVLGHQLIGQTAEGQWYRRKIPLASQWRRLAAFFRNGDKSTYLATRRNLVRVSFLLFLNIAFNLITSNISQKVVIVDDSILIDSRTKLFQTDKWACWFDDSDFDYFRRSNEGSDLWRVTNQMKQPDGNFCFLNHFFEDPTLIGDFPITKTFFLSKKLNTLFALNLFAGLGEDKIIFQANSILDFELVQALYMSKRMNEKTKQRLAKK